MLRNDTFRNIALTSELHDYLLTQGRMTPDPLLAELAERTRTLTPDQAHMVVAPEEAALLTFLVRLLGARNVVEVGTFTGSSSLCLARGLAADGSLITCDISAEWTDLAHEFWIRDGVADRIELRLGPAVDTLRALPAEPHLDLAFIDADKPGYIDYWEELVPRMRPDALILVDNTLFSGQVIDEFPGEKPAAVHAFNEHAREDERVELVMLAVADGLTMARRLP
ncbi:O-methyltransferase [Streptomyces spectabilis]|uniref:Caffeoyl-CoA O-methyltransferase n=2 Tax=Streptomyces spectabilis TaxID=68270 RepID=A0A7W8ETX5_STRST|nr:class I SAM-dependent methyltransferase [Streptomyces spectabilis]MBB5105252.1 caffeoyl-CoA O-methyltransferase [Streptomyces spectabilis]MCI3906446.1 class I SAM-dependent methyltransferase [Streptomyces spectabilis]GGV51526.1 O-methyltransferase [Streptomyces spectabilis]